MQDANADGNRAAVSMIQSMVLLLNLMAGKSANLGLAVQRKQTYQALELEP